LSAVPKQAAAWPRLVTHLECGLTGKHYPADELLGLSEAGRPLLVRYDLDAIRERVSRDDLASRAPSLWRYSELLPLGAPEEAISLGEVMTPLIDCPRVAAQNGAGKLWVKDEGRLPTGSFKARGLALAVSMARRFGVKRMAIPTAGNAGAAMAAYCTRGGMESYIFCPDDTPEANIRETALQGGKIYRVNGLINDCGKIVGDGKEPMGWFDCSTLKEPYRIEGKKTMGLELAEQLGWQVPDVIFYPTGGGTGLIGMWKAFAELEALGWIGAKRPRMVAVQSTGCAPIVRAFEEGTEHAELWQDAHTIAMGLRVPVAVGDFLILRAVRESNGFAIAVDDAEMERARDEFGAGEGLLLGLEGAATYAAWKTALADGRVRPDETAVLFNCGSGLKADMPAVDRRIDRHKPIDWAAL
jgi:threonine synthase